jgi:hypothetical protein
MQAPSVGFNYLIEAYGVLAGDCFVAVTFVRAIVSFAWTFFEGWTDGRGVGICGEDEFFGGDAAIGGV